MRLVRTQPVPSSISSIMPRTRRSMESRLMAVSSLAAGSALSAAGRAGSSSGSALFKIRSRYLNWSQALTKGPSVLLSPMPMTSLPASRRRAARRVKSLSDETMQNPSRLPEYSRSMASMIMAESVAFLPVV